MEPSKYWEGVPLRLLDKLHFLNTPVTIDHKHNPLRYIKQIADVDDFVSFKLGEFESNEF